jgi:hypothetical protein
MRIVIATALLFCIVTTTASRAQTSRPGDACGDLVTLGAHGKSTISYSLGGVAGDAKPRIVLVILPGGPGFADLDAKGCARKLPGESMLRSRSLFHRAGLATALVDAPTDFRGEDGLGGFRIAQQHAEDVGKVIADVRDRAKLPVWLAGTSRGTISAANAAARLTGRQAPDGLVLTSPITSGREGGYKAWVAQTVFSVNLRQIRVPLLVVAHAADACIRTPPHLAASIAPQTSAPRKQTVVVKGGSGRSVGGLDACQGDTPHGFAGQDGDLVAGIVRFADGGSY